MAKCSTSPPRRRVPRGTSLIDSINAVQRGAFLAEAEEQFAAVIDAARERGKPATLTLRLKVDFGGGDGRAMEIDASVKAGIPPSEFLGRVYVDGAKNVYEKDPTQMTFLGL